ncbi:MAG: DUF4870 domain-containing protein [Actinomycetia bacterium]|nr:DUF4870 domain-containing protein [Actinomycetes bacterium]
MSDDIHDAPSAPDVPPAPPAPEAPPAPSASQAPPPPPPMSAPPGPGPAVPGAVDSSAKLMAGFGYLLGIPALVAILVEPFKDDPWVRPHAVQALGLCVASIVIGIVANIPFIGWIVGMVGGIGVVVLAIIGAVKAFQGESYEMPIINGLVKQFL